MRTISAAAITETVARLCIQANTKLPDDITAALDRRRKAEPWPLAKETLELLWDNLDAARACDLPICQDTGMAVIFAELGQDTRIVGGYYTEQLHSDFMAKLEVAGIDNMVDEVQKQLDAWLAAN